MKYPVLCELTTVGLQIFENVFMGKLEPDALDIHDAKVAAPIHGTGELDVTNFETTKDMARAVLVAIGPAKLQESLPRTGLWAWLTFVMRDQLFKRDAAGRYIVRELHRWYPSDPNDYYKAQRHLVRMPTLLLHSFGEDADHLLCGLPSILPEIREQLTSQQDMLSKPFQRVARALYFDDAKGALKTGAGGKKEGTPRRLAKVRLQLDVTWDLDDLSFDRVIGKLPKEFARFKPKAVATPNSQSA